MEERVLLVDDEEKFLEMMAERMRARGMQVTTATSAAEAVRTAEKESFDAIVLDLKMPDMDGIEVLKLLKQKRPDSQIILLTGHATVEKGIEAMKLGAMDFLEKPADLNELSNKIKEAQTQKMLIVEKNLEEKVKQIIIQKGW